jgi:hypothetical protein
MGLLRPILRVATLAALDVDPVRTGFPRAAGNAGLWLGTFMWNGILITLK